MTPTLIQPIVNSEILISQGEIPGVSVVNKFGRNPDVDTGSVPEDIWAGGGVYTGFPVGPPEEFEVFSSDAGDTGAVTFTYLPSPSSSEYLTATVTLNGTTPVNTGITGYRMHTAQYSSGTINSFNLGTITIRHRITTSNVFCAMPIGRSQTNVCAYTVPARNVALIHRIFCRVIGQTTSTVDGSLWVRGPSQSPRLRRPFTAGSAIAFEEQPFAGLSIAAGSDITIRITAASANNTDVIAGFDLILRKL